VYFSEIKELAHMTQPSPQDELPPGPWTICDDCTVIDANGVRVAAAELPPIARAIAAIPEMRAELERRQLIIDAAMAGDIDRLRAENQRLRSGMHMMLYRLEHANADTPRMCVIDAIRDEYNAALAAATTSKIEPT
jgi:hypothetical protein